MLDTPLIGIWWDNINDIVAITHSPGDNSSGELLVDSNFSHNEEWPRIRRQLKLPSTVEYFEVPRGRVLLQSTTSRGLIYHGNATSPQRLSEIARVFQLTSWTARFDEHYATGAEADLIFNED